MKLKDKFKGNRLQQVNDFIKSLTYEWKPLSLKEIEKTFFNNSRSFRQECITILEYEGIIEIDKAEDRTYKDGKWITNANRYRLTGSSPSQSKVKVYHFDGEFITIDHDKDVKTFNYCLKLTKSTFGKLWKDAVLSECRLTHLTDSQAEFLWQKFEEKSKQKAIQDI